MNDSHWYLYLIECHNGRLYTGITTDLAARFAKHLSGKGAKFTRANPPQRMLAAQDFADRSSASRAEYRFKQLTPAQKRLQAADWSLQDDLPGV